MFDFDIDFCMDCCDEVIDYVVCKYGCECVSQIIIYGIMVVKVVVCDFGCVFGFLYGLVDGVFKLIFNILGIYLKDVLGKGKEGFSLEMVLVELIQCYEIEDDVCDLIDLVLQLEDLICNVGKYVGGVVIGFELLSEFCLLYVEYDENGFGKNLVIQFDKNDVEEVGLVKFDFFGLCMLIIIDWVVKVINKCYECVGILLVDIVVILFDDVFIYKDIFVNGNIGVVFQFEFLGMCCLLKDVCFDCFEDLIVLVLLYCFGLMDLIFLFNVCKYGQEEIIYFDLCIEVILKDIYGIMVYQEQVMQMVQIVGGYLLGGVDLLCCVMGKKVLVEMVKYCEIFCEGVVKGGVDGLKVDEIFDLMEKFVGYGFNKLYVVVYVLVSYQIVWLKWYYLVEFMVVMLFLDLDNIDKVVGFFDEVCNFGLIVLLLKVNQLVFMFEVVMLDMIQYGLGVIKGVGQGVCEVVVEE